MTLQNVSTEKKITKEEFLAAYNQYLPNAFTKFVFKYFSKQTTKEDSWLKNIARVILMILFFAGFFTTAFKLPRIFIAIPTITFGVILVLVVGSMFIAGMLNNARIRKIRKILNVSKIEYNKLAEEYIL
jgi:protein-S-isoprenylcysteine O-methyltransferase Ste14